MRKTIIILAALFCVVTGCGKQVEDVGKTANTPTNKSMATNTIKSGNTSTANVSQKPTKPENIIMNEIKKILPNGKYEATTFKRVYQYPNSKDEKQENLLEEKYKKGIAALLEKEKSMKEYPFIKEYYHKDIPFREYIFSPLNNTIESSLFVNEDYITQDEWEKLIKLYKSAKLKFVEDKKISIEVRHIEDKTIIASTPKTTMYLDKLTIDYISDNVLIGNNSYVRATDIEENKYEPNIHGIDKSNIIINNEDLKVLSYWFKEVDMSYSTVISLCQLKESKMPIIRYVFYDFPKNKFTEDIILINK